MASSACVLARGGDGGGARWRCSATDRSCASWGRHTLRAEELARDVESLAADDDNLLAAKELLGDNRGESAKEMALAIDDDLEDAHKGQRNASSILPCKAKGGRPEAEADTGGLGDSAVSSIHSRRLHPASALDPWSHHHGCCAVELEVTHNLLESRHRNRLFWGN